ncbi:MULTISPECIES: AI-2E family transporter [unclassified Bradyrhizobium]|uniref:AI-2E family transporter n=1 Tax=unclassified Bradyrhizobium TaxID=2631580 RepID=UPI001BA7EF0A|nr:MULTISPECIES: AI-2E family transporter [unclassified Bradyrhizobium]MBR1224246.1 AI-2E family transporter [Bradyrhizobium sp. AUGA SZCCT0176]MBR1297130.1 AI-2E family transporter [Bradyrhizobium sp. AUGA SZCCT0042]
MIGALVVAALYFTREILVPIAVAILLSFVLSPLVRAFQRMKVPRSIAVLSAVSLALAIALSLAAMVMIEVNQLASDLPRYQSTLGEKIHNLRDRIGSVGVLKNASSLLKNLDRELKSPGSGDAETAKPSLSDGPAKTPIPVEVHQPDPGASEALIAMLRPLAAPFTTTGIVVIFLIFFLFQREDLRDRFIRLLGSEDLERTTAALDDAGQRLGRLFLTQLILNATFGVVIGLGLAVIGVPSSPLWGLLAMILRFVPYIGAILAAGLPIALAAAVGSDWTMTLWTIALFAMVEPLTGHVVEPLVCGRSAGLSPVAVVVAASFWTWLWGPLGLLLSTPLTLCLVVFARHVDRLQFIDVMLGDQPALTPQQTAYQRMLTGDPIDAIEQARSFLKRGSALAYYEEILLGALRLAEADAAQGRLDDVRLENIHETVSEIIEDIAAHETAEGSAGAEVPARKGKIVNIDARKLGKPVFCIPGLGRLDDCAALIVADALKREGFNARVSGADTEIDAGNAETICVCFLEEVSEARSSFTVRKFSRRAASARIIVCRLGNFEADKEQRSDDVAPQSLATVIAAVAKSASVKTRREQ